MGNVKVAYEIEESFSNAYSLIIWQDNEPCDAVVSCSHVYEYDGDERDGLFLVSGDVASCGEG